MVNEPLADASDMFMVHTMFRREFGLMPDLVRAVAAGDGERVALVAGHVDLVALTLDTHHSEEDKHVWPRLRERCHDECAALVDVMQDQHHTVHTYLLRVTEAAQAWRDSTSTDARDALADAIGPLLAALTEHLALEEERIVPLIEKYITEAEWSLVPQDAAANFPPDKLTVVFGMTIYEADPAVIDQTVAHMPAEARPVIKDLATQAYAAYAKELYGTSTPPRVTG